MNGQTSARVEIDLSVTTPSRDSMSRAGAPPFPTRQNRSPSVSKNNVTSPPGSITTKPLQITRPTTPSNSYDSPRPTNGPSRPQRSELRARTSEDRNGNSTPPRAARNSPNTPSGSRQAQRQQTEDDATSPTLNTVLSAFQSAGTRRRGMTNDEMEYQRQRDEEKAAEMARQQQYQKRMAGKRTAAKPRPGDIDGV